MKSIINFILALCTSLPLFAQVGIGTTTPDTSSILEIENVTKGILVPRMTESDRDAITSPAEGLLIYQTDNGADFYYYNGTAWVTFGGGSVWATSGNSGTTPATNMLGTSDTEGLSIVANNAEAIHITSDDKVGINTNTPAASLHIVNSIRIQDGNETDGYVLTSDANGNGVWTDLTTGPGSDDDWAFVSGNTNTDPIYRIGGVTIGDDSPTGTTYFSDPLLHIKTEPSFFPDPELGFGSNSYFSRSTQEIVVNNNVVLKSIIV